MKQKINWMMMACIIPLVLLVALSFFGIANSYLRWILLLLCPIMMLFMMFGKDSCGSHEGNPKKINMKKVNK